MSPWILVLACFSSGMCVYCVLARFNKRSIELAVNAAVHEVKKELHARHLAMASQLATKERELVKARELVKLHEAVPSPALRAAPAPAGGSRAKAGAKADEKPARREGLEVFAMSRPFTDTSFNQLLASTDVVSVEAAPVKGG